MTMLMLDPEGRRPEGWTVATTVDDLQAALATLEPGRLLRASLRGSLHDTQAAYQAIRTQATSWYFLLGHDTLERIHFHDPCLGTATTCHSHALQGMGGDGSIETDTCVPLGGLATWDRARRRVTLPGMDIADSVATSAVGRRIGDMIHSPMLDPEMIVHAIERGDGGSIIHASGREDTRPWR